MLVVVDVTGIVEKISEVLSSLSIERLVKSLNIDVFKSGLIKISEKLVIAKSLKKSSCITTACKQLPF